MTAAVGPAPATAADAPATAAQRLHTALPLIVIRTPRAIPDDPKIGARVRVIDRRGRRLNRTSDAGNVYTGRAGIERRGHSSQMFPKKQYGIELRDSKGEGRDAALLGMPADDDWVLSAPYTDKSLMRNVVAYRTSRGNFGRYAPRTRYAEVVLNGRYRGVYALIQRLELGKGRIPAPDRSWLAELVFGYQALGERSFTTPITRRPILFADPDDPGRAQTRRIRGAVARLERALYGRHFQDPRRGWRRHLDYRAAADYVLQQELFRNQDGFHASTYFHRAPGRRIALGPVWDFDIAAGNTTSRARGTRGWQLGGRPWAERLYRDRGFVRRLLLRWRQVRRAGLRRQILRGIAADTRTLRSPQRRNFNRWRVLGRYVWPNPRKPSGGYRTTWRGEVRYLRRWIGGRIRFMDRALPRLARR